MGREGNKVQSQEGCIFILASLEKHLISVFESLSKYSYNLNQNQIDKLIEIYKFITKNQHSVLFICYDTIIKMVQTFNQEQKNFNFCKR